MRKINLLISLLLILALAACAVPTPPESPAATPTLTSPTLPATQTPSLTPSPSATLTATITRTPTITQTPTITSTPTITPTPTFDFPDGVVKEEQAFCRYGPGKAYLHAHSLVKGDHLLIQGRTSSGSWLWVQPDELTWHCWAAASVMEITGSIKNLRVQPIVLPITTFAGPPNNVRAVRNGNEVTVSWDLVPLSVDKNRGYLLDVKLCQNGASFWGAYQTMDTSYTFSDDPACGGSGGTLRTAEKHGYSETVPIPWP
jgi:hypothetical protein